MHHRQSVSTGISITVVIILLVIGSISLSLYLNRSESTTTLSPSPTSTYTPPPTSTFSTSSSLQKVTFMTPFAFTEAYTAYFYGLAKGYYTQNGIDLTIISGTPTGAVSAMALGKVQFSETDPTTLAFFETQNVSNVRMVAAMQKSVPYAVLYNKAVIHSLSDLDGKTMGVGQGAISLKLFPIFCRMNGISCSSIKQTVVQPSSVNSLLATGKVDFILQTINAYVSIAPIASTNNIQVGNFSYARYGLLAYGFGIITSTQMIQSDPALVQHFINATEVALIQAAQNPSAAVASLVKYNPQLNYTSALKGWEILLANDFLGIKSDAYLSNPLSWGWMNQTIIQSSLTLVTQGYDVTAPPASQVYTNQFVKSLDLKP